MKFIRLFLKELMGDKALLVSVSFLFFYAYAIICWPVNVYMFLSCDFDGPWKDEIIHGVGLLPAFSWITVWF